MIILDASGSMTNPDAPGPRIDAAKRAVIELINSLPAGSPVGLLAYGTGTGSGDAEKAEGCKDVKQVVPLGPVDKPAFIGAVEAITARGYTPMGSALLAAAEKLPRRGPASIVLVSDGIDTCAPPSTCDTARTLKAEHVDLVIHTVGFKEDAAARAELSCVAAAGGGTYRSAADGPGLTAVLQGQVDAALRPYIVAGTPIKGTRTPAGAPSLDVGQYWDTLAAGATVTSHYAIELARDETAYIASTVVPAALRGGGADSELSVVAQLEDESGNRCLPTERESDALLAGKVDPVTALISGVVGGPDWSKRCPEKGTFIVSVSRDSASSVPTRVEMVVQLEPPVAEPGPLVTAVPGGLPSPAPSRAATVSGGASFNTAPVLSDGTYSDSLSTGETRYYKVRLNWGQRLSYNVVVDKLDGLAHESGYVRTAVATPLRQELPLSPNSNAARGYGGPESVSMTGSTLVPVHFANRDSGRSDVRAYSMAGDYYLSVGMSYPVDAVPYRTGISLSVQVVGDAEPGPQYEPVPASRVTRPSDPSTGLPSSPVPQSSVAAAVTATEAVDQAGAESTGSGVPWLVITGILIAAAALTTFLVLKRSKLGR